MPKRGRPFTYTPGVVSQDDVQCTRTLVEACTPSTKFRMLQNYRVFCTINAFLPASHNAKLLFIAQQRNAGIDALSCANQLEMLTHVHDIGASEQCDQRRQVEHALRKEKALTGGCKKKPWWSVPWLMSCLGNPENERDIHYHTFWWFLIVTGIRPAEHLGATIACLDATSIHVMLASRKEQVLQGDLARVFLFEWSCPPPAHVKKCLANKGVPQFTKSAASCLNSWLSKVFNQQEVTSTSPRVSLDNILHRKANEGIIAVDHYEWLMGHSSKTSTLHYMRTRMQMGAEPVTDEEVGDEEMEDV